MPVCHGTGHVVGAVPRSLSVTSAGLLAGGQRPPAEVISVMAARGIDVAGHRSRHVTAADLAAADLVLGLAREHARHAAVLLPDCWPRTFTLRELLRRGRKAGAPRGRTSRSATGWRGPASAAAAATCSAAAPATTCADPYGGPLGGYQATADLLDGLTRDLAALCRLA